MWDKIGVSTLLVGKVARPNICLELYILIIYIFDNIASQLVATDKSLWIVV